MGNNGLFGSLFKIAAGVAVAGVAANVERKQRLEDAATRAKLGIATGDDMLLLGKEAVKRAQSELPKYKQKEEQLMAEFDEIDRKSIGLFFVLESAESLMENPDLDEFQEKHDDGTVWYTLKKVSISGNTEIEAHTPWGDYSNLEELEADSKKAHERANEIMGEIREVSSQVRDCTELLEKFGL